MYSQFIWGIIQSPIIFYLQLNIYKSDFTAKAFKLIKKRITKNLNSSPLIGGKDVGRNYFQWRLKLL